MATKKLNEKKMRVKQVPNWEKPHDFHRWKQTTKPTERITHRFLSRTSCCWALWALHWLPAKHKSGSVACVTFAESFEMCILWNTAKDLRRWNKKQREKKAQPKEPITVLVCSFHLGPFMMLRASWPAVGSGLENGWVIFRTTPPPQGSYTARGTHHYLLPGRFWKPPSPSSAECSASSWFSANGFRCRCRCLCLSANTGWRNKKRCQRQFPFGGSVFASLRVPSLWVRNYAFITKSEQLMDWRLRS